MSDLSKSRSSGSARFPSRRTRLAIEIERDGDVSSGVAFAGGFWTGPIWSNLVEFDFEIPGAER